MSRPGPGWDLAIDFGTSFTTTATLAGGRAEVLEIDGSKYVPSLVCVDEDGTILVGRDAVNESAMAPGRTDTSASRVGAGAGPAESGASAIRGSRAGDGMMSGG